MASSLSVANLIDRAAAKYGDREFIKFDHPMEYEYIPQGHDGTSATFNEGLQITNCIAAVMKNELGVKAGDRIAVALTNIPELGLTFMAAARIGAITVPFNYMLKAEELTRSISDCGAKVLVTEPGLFALNIRDKANIPGIEHWVMTGPKNQVPDEFLSIDTLTDGYQEAQVEPVVLDPDETAAIFYTSGTTGFPKGAMLSSRNLLSTITKTTRMLRLGTRDFGVAALPIAHIFGFTTSIVGGLYCGASGILMQYFDPEKALHNIEKYRATLFLGVPAMYNIMLLFNPEKYDLSSMRYWLSGADAMPVEHIERLEKLGGKFIEGYGLVETSPIISVNPPFLRRAGTVGMPMPGVKVKVMDENGSKIKRGKVGEFVVRGANVMKGYWGDDDRTAEAFKYGWFHTGDIGFRDRLGYLHFVDREKDVVKAGGYSVFSREVEEEMLQHPAVFEVALVGAPHPTKGEAPVAFVQLKVGEDVSEEELLAWCKEHIAAYKSPRVVRIIDAMPLNMTMKVLKRELRQQLIDEGLFLDTKQ
jgi:long-chain acyl-CoA synthetase